MTVALNEAVSYLSENDKVLSELIERIGKVKISRKRNYFKSLVKSIISQQLSTKAASTIYGRFADLCNNVITPIEVSKIEILELRKIGVSNQKSVFIKGLAEFLLANPRYFRKLLKLENAQVIHELTKIKGIGEWTAQMFLIFCLGRLDVLPLNDAGLQRSISFHYKLKKKPNRIKFETLALRWGKYSSVAAIYLWRAIDD